MHESGVSLEESPFLLKSYLTTDAVLSVCISMIFDSHTCCVSWTTAVVYILFVHGFVEFPNEPLLPPFFFHL